MYWQIDMEQVGQGKQQQPIPQNPNHKTVKYSGVSVMAGACIAASATGSQIFIYDGSHNGSSINSDTENNVLSANLRRNASKCMEVK